MPEIDGCYQGHRWGRCGKPAVATIVPPERYENTTPRRYCEDHARRRENDCREIRWDDAPTPSAEPPLIEAWAVVCADGRDCVHTRPGALFTCDNEFDAQDACTDMNAEDLACGKSHRVVRLREVRDA